MPVGSHSDLISKRVTGKKSCSKHSCRQAGIEVPPPVDNPKSWPIQQRSRKNLFSRYGAMAFKNNSRSVLMFWCNLISPVSSRMHTFF